MNFSAPDRRAPAAHPGLVVKRDYLDVIGIDAATFARSIAVDPLRVAAMLDGRASIDVETAIRIARVLQLSADRIMRMQIAADFAAARTSPVAASLELLRPVAPQAFPAAFLHGKLRRTGDDTRGEASFYFQQERARGVQGDVYAGMHALWRGDRLRVYDAEGRAQWTGPVLHDLDGRLLLPFVESSQWQGWFADARAADLAIGEEHGAFFERMHEV